MLTFHGGRIFLVAGRTDMRKSFNGLAGIVRDRLQADPMSRDMFFFCNPLSDIVVQLDIVRSAAKRH